MAEKKDGAVVFRLINQYISALKERNIKVMGSFLLGSYAGGMVSEWSDIDVAILTDKFIIFFCLALYIFPGLDNS